MVFFAKTFFWAAFVLLVASIQQAGARQLVDQAGRLCTVPDEPLRVVALAPSITEVIYDLGEQQRLVGATEYSNYPDEAKKLPRVGSYVRLDLERIVALRPDLCIAIKDGNPKQVVDRLEDLGIPVFVIHPQNLDQVVQVVEILGDLLGAKARGLELAASMRRRIDGVRQRVAARRHSPSVFFQIAESPLVAVGTRTFIHELISMAGGTNATAGAEPYPRYNWEEILLLDPEVVVITTMVGNPPADRLTAPWRQWPELRAVVKERLHIVSADLFNRPSPRLVDGLEALAPLLHPEFFPKEATP